MKYYWRYSHCCISCKPYRFCCFWGMCFQKPSWRVKYCLLGKKHWQRKVGSFNLSVCQSLLESKCRCESSKRFHLLVVWPRTSTGVRWRTHAIVVILVSRSPVLLSNHFVVVTWCLALLREQRTMETFVPPHMPICFEAGRSWLPFLQRYNWRGGYVACYCWKKALLMLESKMTKK